MWLAAMTGHGKVAFGTPYIDPGSVTVLVSKTVTENVALLALSLFRRPELDSKLTAWSQIFFGLK